ncbi:hypothetical protein H0H93_005795 [Arthromyces matolae]|nr:hypothetical protein H0H93_005795 [Arthromyces matolae]
MDSFYEWMPKWTQNNFRTANGDPVKNSALIKYISALFKARGLIGQEVRMQYVKGHSGDVGNDGADAQANLGAFLPPIPERDWAKAEKEVLDQAEQDCRTTVQRSTPVPLEVVAGELTTSISGGAQKVRKISHDVPFSRLPSPSLGSPRLRHKRLSSTSAVASSSTTSRSGPPPLHVTSPLRVVDVSSSPPIDPTSKAVPAPFRVANVSSSPSRDLATQTGPSLGIHKAKGPLAARDASIPESLFASTSTSLSASTSPPKSVAAHAIHKPSLSEETLKLPMSPTSPIRRKHGVGFFTTTPPANALFSTRLSPPPAKKMGLGMGSGAGGYGPSSTNNQKAMRVDVADVDFNVRLIRVDAWNRFG